MLNIVGFLFVVSTVCDEQNVSFWRVYLEEWHKWENIESGRCYIKLVSIQRINIMIEIMTAQAKLHFIFSSVKRYFYGSVSLNINLSELIMKNT